MNLITSEPVSKNIKHITQLTAQHHCTLKLLRHCCSAFPCVISVQTWCLQMCLNRLDKSEFKWGSVEQQQNIMLQMEWKHRNHGLSLGWQINRYSGHSTDWIFVHGPCGSLAYLKVDAALRDWPALQLWENGKAWWSVGKVHQCCVSTYSQLQADLKNLQREKEIRLQTQQKWAISTPTASLDADWLILSQIWTFSS